MKFSHSQIIEMLDELCKGQEDIQVSKTGFTLKGAGTELYFDVCVHPDNLRLLAVPNTGQVVAVGIGKACQHVCECLIDEAKVHKATLDLKSYMEGLNLQTKWDSFRKVSILSPPIGNVLVLRSGNEKYAILFEVRESPTEVAQLSTVYQTVVDPKAALAQYLELRATMPIPPRDLRARECVPVSIEVELG